MCTTGIPAGAASRDAAPATAVWLWTTSGSNSWMRDWMARAGVAKPKWPERVELVDELPTTPSGKVQKFRLREIVAELRAAEESRPGGTDAGA